MDKSSVDDTGAQRAFGDGWDQPYQQQDFDFVVKWKPEIISSRTCDNSCFWKKSCLSKAVKEVKNVISSLGWFISFKFSTAAKNWSFFFWVKNEEFGRT